MLVVLYICQIKITGVTVHRIEEPVAQQTLKNPAASGVVLLTEICHSKIIVRH